MPRTLAGKMGVVYVNGWQEYCERMRQEWFAEIVVAEIWDLQERVIAGLHILPSLNEVLGIAEDAQLQPELLSNMM